jgi:hypothetical protein
MVAYPPALFFSDSWGYLFTAFTGHPVSLSYLRPNGYPVLLRLLTLPGRNLDQLIALQHLSGLLLATLVYVALLRARTPRLLALAAAALILLDGYRVTLEQYVMPDTLFTFTLLCAALLVAWPRLDPWRPDPSTRRRAWQIGLAGLLLAASILQREAAFFALPLFVIYLAWSRVGARAGLAFVLAVAVPVLAYAAIYQAKLGVFGLSESDGWMLYGRVAAFASCPGAGIPAFERRLCETPAQRASHPPAPTWYIWDGDSPASRVFPRAHDYRRLQERANTALNAFSRRIILHQPLDYLDATFSDALRYFTPGATPFNDRGSATSLPAKAGDEPRSERVRRRVIPAVHPHVRSPSGLVTQYRRILHVPRPWLGVLAIASLLALVLPSTRRYRPIARAEVLFLSGSGLLLILGTAATAGFGLRYLLPAVPLLALGGSLALRDLIPGLRVDARPVSLPASAPRSLPR